MWKTTRSFTESVRLPLCFISAICVIEGYWLAIHRFILPGPEIWLAAIATAFALGFANVVNDILDSDTDRVNHPERPIPAGHLSVATAKQFSVYLLLLSMFFGMLAGWMMFFLCLFTICLAQVYNLWAKRILVIGKLIVAFLSSLTIMVGHLLSPGTDIPVIPFFSMFLFLLSRDFASTVSDLQGDQIAGRNSECATWGKSSTLMISLLLGCIAGVTLALGVYQLHDTRRLVFLICFCVLSLLPFLFIILSIAKNSTVTNIRKVVFRSRILFVTNILLFFLLV